MGLGLAICSDLVRGFGGTLEAHNNAGGGATCRVLLPVEGGGPPAANAAEFSPTLESRDPTDTSQAAIARSRQLRAETLVLYLRLALTSLRSAQTHSDSAFSRRGVRHALVTLQATDRLLAQQSLPPARLAELSELRAQILELVGGLE